MSTSLDIEISADVVEVLAEVGTDARFTGNTATTYDHATGTVTETGSAIDETVKAAPPFEYTIREIDDKNIRRDDLRTIVHGAFVPEKNMTCTIGGRSFQVMAVKPYYSGDDVAAYEVQLRR